MADGLSGTSCARPTQYHCWFALMIIV